MARIFFVGMHNKPGMEPLDSRTMTGKIIDEIIQGLGCECVKTNFCDTDYQPTEFREIAAASLIWSGTHKPNDGDTVVVLGDWVDKYIILSDYLKKVKLIHPAAIKVREIGIGNYINESIEKIKSAIPKIIFQSQGTK